MEQRLSQSIGNRIRLYRKNRGLSLDELAARVHKSKASISKYELGQTTIDIVTLYEIADALGISPAQLLDTDAATAPMGAVGEPLRTEQHHVYFLTKKQLSRSLLALDFRGESDSCAATLFHDISGTDAPTSCKSIYRGRMYRSNVMMSVMLQSIRIPASNVLLAFALSLNNEKTCLGLLSGIGSGRVKPMSMRVLLTASPIKDEEAVIRYLRVNAEVIRLLKREERFFAISEDTTGT